MKLFVTYLSLGIMLLAATASMAGTDDALIAAKRQVDKSQKIVKASREAAESAQRFIIANDKEISTRQSQLDAAKRTEEDQASQFDLTTAALKGSPGDLALLQALSNRRDALNSARRSTRAMENALKDAKIERDRAASNSSKAQAALEAATEAQSRAQNQFADAKIAKLKVRLGNPVETPGNAEEGPCLIDPIPACEQRLRTQAIDQALNIGREAIVRRIQTEFGLSPDEIMQVAKITVSGEPKVTELNADKRGGRARVNAVVAGQLTSSGESSLHARWGDKPSEPVQSKLLQGSVATGTVFRDCPDCPEMVVIPAGSINMNYNYYDNEKPINRVNIGKTFALGKTEVTQGQWKAVMGSPPPKLKFKNCGDNCPVESVSWNDAQEFIKKLNAKTGKQYRLPSESEWEYACRAGGKQNYCGSNDIDAVAWYVRNSGYKTHPVHGKQANAFGLYDMIGNVWEWVADCYNNNSNQGAPTDGSARKSRDCNVRVLRGGSLGEEPDESRSTSREEGGLAFRFGSYGFRLARMLP